jgi:hypothetical protein
MYQQLWGYRVEDKLYVGVKQSRFTPWRRLGGEDVQLLLILDLGTRWGWVVSVTPRPRFITRERTPGTHCTGGWVGSRAGLDTEVTGKILCPCRGSNLDRPVVQSVARHYTDWATRRVREEKRLNTTGLSQAVDVVMKRRCYELKLSKEQEHFIVRRDSGLEY